MNLLLAATLHGDALLETLIIGVIVIGLLAAAAFIGLRAVGKLTWAANTAGAIIILGVLLLLLILFTD